MGSIETACPVCGHQYKIDERFTGKRMKCRKCGSAMPIPASAQAPEVYAVIPPIPSPQERLADETIPLVPPPVPAPRARQRSVSAELNPRQSGQPFDFPNAQVLDEQLPFWLCVVGYGLPALSVLASFSGLWAMHFVLHVCVVIPAALFAVGIVAGIMKFSLPEQSILRIAAVLAVPAFLGYTRFWPGAVWLYFFPAGWLVGLVPAFFVFWFLFRLKEREAVCGFFAAIAASIIASALVGWVLTSITGRPTIPNAVPRSYWRTSTPPSMPGPGFDRTASPPPSALIEPSNTREFETRDLLAGAQAAYHKLKSLELAGVFRTETVSPSGTSSIAVRFTAVFQAPNFFRLDYIDQASRTTTEQGPTDSVSPRGSYAVCSGNRISMCSFSDRNEWYELDVPTGRFQGSDKRYLLGGHFLDGLRQYNPALLLATTADGVNVLAPRFGKLTRLPDVPLDGKNFTAIELSSPAHRPLTLLIDPQTRLIRRAAHLLRAPDGQQETTHTVDYTTIRPDVPVPESRFRFEPRAGAKPGRTPPQLADPWY